MQLTDEQKRQAHQLWLDTCARIHEIADSDTTGAESPNYYQSGYHVLVEIEKAIGNLNRT